jgi:hypothetical protein
VRLASIFIHPISDSANPLKDEPLPSVPMAVQPNSQKSCFVCSIPCRCCATAAQSVTAGFDTLQGHGKMDGKVVGSKLVPFKGIHGSAQGLM